MYLQWLFPTLITAGLQWYARWGNHRRLHIITKPTVILFLIGWLWQATHFQGFSAWFGMALLFSLLGDILLIFPPSFFLAGLAAFLMGHVFYSAGFLSEIRLVFPGLLAVGLLTLIMMISAVRFTLTALQHRTVSKGIQAGVAVYTVVIHLMLFSALSTLWQPRWLSSGALLVSTGALLFGFSDGLLAYDRFIKKVPRAHTWIMMTYHLAQILIIAGAIQRFLQASV